MMESTFATYDTYDIKSEMADMVWKIQPFADESSILLYANKRHTDKVEHSIIEKVDVSVENARHVTTRKMLDTILSSHKIVIDSFKHSIVDGNVIFYGTGFKLKEKNNE